MFQRVAKIAMVIAILSLSPAQAVEIGENVLVDITGQAKNWETATVISKDATGYTVRMLGVGVHQGEHHVPEHYIHGYHQKAPAGLPNTGAPQTQTGSKAPLTNPAFKVGEFVVVDVSGAGKTWESGKIVSVDATGYTIEMLGVGQHQGRYQVPEHYIYGAPTLPAAQPKTGTAQTPPVANVEARPAPAPPPAAPPQAVGGSTGLSGLYLRHEQVFMGTSLSYREDHYLFFPDGRVYHGVPPEGPSRFNWAKEQQAHPERCGRYGINGDKITMSYGGAQPYTWPIKIKSAKEMELNIAPTVKVEPFAANAKITGNYQRGTTFGPNYSQTGAPTVTAAGTYIFQSNGTVSADNLSAADGDTDVTGVTVRVQQGQQGTYSVSGNDMTLTLGGRTLHCTAYPIYDRDSTQLPARISIDGALYERKK
jgi:hypothetical protein